MLKKRLAIGVATCSLLGTALAPSLLTVHASEVSVSNVSESTEFDVVDDTTLFDKRDGVLYEFGSNEEMVKHMESPVESSVSGLASRASSSSEWKHINFAYFTKAEVKEMAQDVQRNQSIGNFAQLAAAWSWKFPWFAAGLGTLGTLLSNHDSQIITAANNNQSMVMDYYEKVNWNGYGPRTRTTTTFYD